MKTTSHARGMYAELAAILYLFFKGYRILKWRYKTGVGEIDILAERGGQLVCVEVKNRAGMETALEAVTPLMQSRIARCAKVFISKHPGYFDKSVRFDVIAISGWRIRHLDNAWLEHT